MKTKLLRKNEAAIIIRADGVPEAYFPDMEDDPEALVPDCAIAVTVLLHLLDDGEEMNRLYERYFRIRA